MKKIVFLMLLMSIFRAPASAQKQGQERIDSMLVVLKSSAEDTNKVTLLNDICFTYYAINPDEGLIFGNQALALAEKLKWKYGIAQANSRIGSNYFGKADYPNALTFWLKALKQNEEIGNKKSVGINLGNIGNIFLLQNDYEKALDYYFRATKLNEESGNKNALALNFGNIGTVYGYQLKFEQGLEYFLKALKIQEEIQDVAGIARSTISIANVYMGLKDYSKALEYNFRALGMVSEFGVTNLVATSQTNIAKNYFELANESNKAQLNNILNGNKNVALQLAKSYNDSAIMLFNEIGDMSALYQTYQSLSEIQSLLGDKSGALESYKNYSLFKDSVFNMEKDKKLTQTTMQYEFDKRKQLPKRNRKKRTFVSEIFATPF
ncbi:MAG: tetratricopeptide repeat protein [Bacteroidetes bacterium]|nr:tetratricopeptide repeat protein [Bacteroidota bacterium]